LDVVVPIDNAFADLHQAALKMQNAVESGNAQLIDSNRHIVTHKLERLRGELSPVAATLVEPIAELLSVWNRPSLALGDIRDMRCFNSLFGRETVYVSFTRSRRHVGV
jgi:hypothetical protein